MDSASVARRTSQRLLYLIFCLSDLLFGDIGAANRPFRRQVKSKANASRYSCPRTAGITHAGYSVSAVSALINSYGASARKSVERTASSFTRRTSVPTQIK